MFSLSLKRTKKTSKGKLNLVDFEPDIIDEVVMEVCEFFSKNNIAEFEVSGFDLNWPVDIETDLSIIIPQIPNILLMLRKDNKASLEFFEQGIERRIDFYLKNKLVELLCNNLQGEAIVQRPEVVSLDSLKDMFFLLIQEFNYLATIYCSDACDNSIYKQWISNFELNIK